MKHCGCIFLKCGSDVCKGEAEKPGNVPGEGGTLNSEVVGDLSLHRHPLCHGHGLYEGLLGSGSGWVWAWKQVPLGAELREEVREWDRHGFKSPCLPFHPCRLTSGRNF